MDDEMDEIWALYADDGMQALDAMESALMALEQDMGEGSKPHVAAFFRAVHTFKGNSRVLGLSVVESRAHLSEDLIGMVRDSGVPLDSEILEILMLSTDTLRTMLEETAQRRADVAPEASEDLMARLRDKIARCSGAPAEPAPVVEPHEAEVAAPVVVVAPAAEPEPAAPLAQTEAPAAVKAPEPVVPEEAPAPAVAPAPVVVASQPVRRLIEDKSYRDIFSGMSVETIGKFKAAIDLMAQDPEDGASRARRAADNLRHAASQMGLDDWAEVLSGFLKAGTPDAEAIAAICLKVEELHARGFEATAATEEGPEGEQGFFSEIARSVERIAALALQAETQSKVDLPALEEATAAIITAARARGYVRVGTAATDLCAVGTPADLRQAELRLYEELGAVEAIYPEQAAAAGLSPGALLQAWCAGQIFEILSAIDSTIDALKASQVGDDLQNRMARLLRQVFHACRHVQLDTAAQLAMSLTDLFARSHAAGKAPDAILTRIARGFIDTLELVFDAIAQGIAPETERLEALFTQAADICFTSDGVLTATAVERRLGLPTEFHRVLSPESVKAASKAIEAGHGFFIIRADINDSEQRAEAFMDWLCNPRIVAITNVTVFRGATTLFDFLVASDMNEADLVETLMAIDPRGRHLTLVRSMRPRDEEPTADLAFADQEEGGQAKAAGGELSAAMLETIGEIAAGHAMVSHMVEQLGESDLSDAIDAAFHSAGGDVAKARAAVRAIVERHASRLREVHQLELQLSNRIEALQEETVSIRSRPVDSILRVIEAHVQTLARRAKTDIAFSCGGGDILLDLTLLDTLRRVLRKLVLARFASGKAPPRMIHISVTKDDEQVLVVFEDDGAALTEDTTLAEVRATLAPANGTLRDIQRPGGGMRAHVSIPLTMVVLEGMVVGIDGVRYVMPVDSIRSIIQANDEAKLRISAAQGREMLRIAQDEIVPVHPIGRSGFGAGERHIYVVLGAAGSSVAVPVTELMGQQLVLLRPLRGVLSKLQNLNGVAVLAGGEVGMVLSAASICSGNEAFGHMPRPAIAAR